jgi:hypothetical protein
MPAMMELCIPIHQKVAAAILIIHIPIVQTVIILTEAVAIKAVMDIMDQACHRQILYILAVSGLQHIVIRIIAKKDAEAGVWEHGLCVKAAVNYRIQVDQFQVVIVPG